MRTLETDRHSSVCHSVSVELLFLYLDVSHVDGRPRPLRADCCASFARPSTLSTPPAVLERARIAEECSVPGLIRQDVGLRILVNHPRLLQTEDASMPLRGDLKNRVGVQ